MSAQRLWPWATFALGAVVLSLFVVFALLPDVRAADACLASGAVVQFELAASVDDLLAIFGPAGGACRPLAVAAMDAVNTLDLWAFIPAYTVFCSVGALFVARGEFRLLSAAAIAAALGATVADYAETTALLEITQRLDDPGGWLVQSHTGAWVKFALLAAHAFFVSGLCWNDARRRPILGLLLLAPALGTLAAWLDPERFLPLMNAGFALAWIALFAVAGKDALSRAPATAAPAPDAPA